MTGTAVLAGLGGDVVPPRIGILLALGGGVAMTGYLFCGRTLRPRLSAVSYVFWTYAVAAVVLGVSVIATSGSLLPTTGREWGLGLLLALFPTLLGHTPLNAALRHLPGNEQGEVALETPAISKPNDRVAR